MKHLMAKWIATFFGVGFLPKAPGSWGSLFALPFAWLIQLHFGAIGLAFAALSVFFLGVWTSEIYVTETGKTDPREVVIDEVAGQWTTLILAPLDWRFYLVGFLLFRLFDIWKPGPVRLMERKLNGGMGIMADDIVAGLISLILLYGLGTFV